jgi:hypothetical protein
MSTPSTPDSQPFLKHGEDVSVDTAGPWGYILTHDGLTVNSTHGKRDVVINSVSAFGKIRFASDQNVLYFGTLSDGDPNAPDSNASTGDALGCKLSQLCCAWLN